MEVTFDATIKMREKGSGWYIQLEDTEENHVEICDDFEMFEEKLKSMSEKYAGRLDEVIWHKDENVTPFVLNEIRLGLMAIEEQINTEKAEAEAYNMQQEE